MDYSDYQLVVDYFYHHDKDNYGWGHDHISPLNLEFANLEWKSSEEDGEEYMMLVASDVTKGKLTISSLDYAQKVYVRKLEEKKTK